MPLFNLNLEFLEAVAAVQKDCGMRSYFIGGVVRDSLHANPAVTRAFDIDVVVEGDATVLAKHFVQSIKADYQIFPKFYTARITLHEPLGKIYAIDFASARSETYSSPGALPQVSLAKLEQDLARRDFTINTLAIWLEDLLQLRKESTAAPDRAALDALVIDHFQGRADLRAGVLRSLHAQSFIDDPTRIFRGVRYKTRLRGKFAEETETQISAALEQDCLSKISHFRKLTELRKICAEQQVGQCFAELERLSVFRSGWLVPFEEVNDLVKFMLILEQQQLSAENVFAMFLRESFLLACAEKRSDFFKRLQLPRNIYTAVVQDVESLEKAQLTGAESPFFEQWLKIREVTSS